MRRTRVAAIAGGAAVVAGSLWTRNNPTPCPYALRFLLWFPRPFLGRRRLIQTLDPKPGERLLEVGPGTGHHAAFAVAQALRPDGVLSAFDTQADMLAVLERRAREQGIDNIETSVGDARSLPYPDASFDGAYLVTVLGEIPDQDAALRELRRVLKPGGRVVFGETVFDPHLVTANALRERTAAAGLRFDTQTGIPAVGFLARFVREGS
jgi:ubiquinone/menaquinone biosynthesis C-methylase UbiE